MKVKVSQALCNLSINNTFNPKQHLSDWVEISHFYFFFFKSQKQSCATLYQTWILKTIFLSHGFYMGIASTGVIFWKQNVRTKRSFNSEREKNRVGETKPNINTSYPSCSWLLSPARPAVQNSMWQKNTHSRKYLIFRYLSNTMAWNFHIIT